MRRPAGNTVEAVKEAFRLSSKVGGGIKALSIEELDELAEKIFELPAKAT